MFHYLNSLLISNPILKKFLASGIESMPSIIFTFIFTSIVTSVASYVAYRFGIRKGINVHLRAFPLHTGEEKKKSAKRGLILIVPLYTSYSKKNITEKEKKQALKNKDYKKLDLEKSNLGHNIEAIKANSHNLEHCWLTSSHSSDAANNQCSIGYTEVLIEYLRNEENISCEFHYGEKYAVSLDSDALICEKTYDMTTNIYKEARKKYKLKPKDIIADVTGGIKSMNLGMVMACMHEDQEIQIIGRKYDSNGKISISDKPYPIKIYFAPKIRK